MIPFEFCPPIFEVASSNPIWQGRPQQGPCDQIMAASGFFQLRQVGMVCGGRDGGRGWSQVFLGGDTESYTYSDGDLQTNL